MSEKESNESFYERFESRLNDITEFPTQYIFKFIIPNENLSLQQIKQIIAQYNLQTTKRYSKNDNYVSYTAEFHASAAEEIIEIYQAFSTVEKVIML